MTRRVVVALVLSVVGLGLAGCAQGSHCQSGAKYGTRCYDVPSEDGQPQTRDAAERRSGSQDPASAPTGNGIPATTPR